MKLNLPIIPSLPTIPSLLAWTFLGGVLGAFLMTVTDFIALEPFISETTRRSESSRLALAMTALAAPFIGLLLLRPLARHIMGLLAVVEERLPKSH